MLAESKRSLCSISTRPPKGGHCSIFAKRGQVVQNRTFVQFMPNAATNCEEEPILELFLQIKPVPRWGPRSDVAESKMESLFDFYETAKRWPLFNFCQMWPSCSKQDLCSIYAKCDDQLWRGAHSRIMPTNKARSEVRPSYQFQFTRRGHICDGAFVRFMQNVAKSVWKVGAFFVLHQRAPMLSLGSLEESRMKDMN